VEKKKKTIQGRGGSPAFAYREPRHLGFPTTNRVPTRPSYQSCWAPLKLEALTTSAVEPERINNEQVSK